MILCIKCKEKEPDSFSSCDNCKIGLCQDCKKKYNELIIYLTRENIKKCNICKTNFYDFCDFCHNQTLSYMICDKLKLLNKNNDIMKKKLIEFNKTHKKWSELTEEMKTLIGEPNEYLKTNWNHCDCDNYLHCYKLAQIELKNKLGIQNYSLYESGLDYLLCKQCYIENLGVEPSNPCD
jgi:hypothetical protein